MEKDKSIKIIHNTYTKSRGAPELLDIFCKNCNIYVMTYQKDGPGELLRCYLVDPEVSFMVFLSYRKKGKGVVKEQ